jgi:hypothetical protein
LFTDLADASSVTNIDVSSLLPSKVVNATIEVQAAADAAAERLKSWLLHQRKVEEQKR